MPALFDRRGSGIGGSGSQQRQWFEYDVGTERERGVTYTNDTGQEMVLDLQSTASSTTEPLIVTVDGETDLRSGNIGTNNGHRQGRMFVIPAGSTYRVSGRDPDRWNELRPSK